MPSTITAAVTDAVIGSTDWNAMRAGVQDLEKNASNYASTAGTQPTYTITLPSAHAPTAYTEGMIVFAKVHSTNTGAATINVNALGAKTIERMDGRNVFPGDLVAGEIVVLLYDGTNFLLLSPKDYKFATVTPVGNVGTGEDDLCSAAIPAGILAVDGDSIEIEAWFSFAANGNNKQVKLYFGASAIYASGAVAQNGGKLHLRAIVTRTGATAQISVVTAGVSNGATMTADVQTGTPGETLSGAVTVKATGEATSDDDISQVAMTIRAHLASVVA